MDEKASLSDFRRFMPTIFEFLEELADNNNRPWFSGEQAALRVRRLAAVSGLHPRLSASAQENLPVFRRQRPANGRFASARLSRRPIRRGGEPYKTNAGIQFRHESARDIHTPGFYVHIAPGECFLAVGTWRPDADTLAQIRQAIVDRPIAGGARATTRRFAAVSTWPATV